MVASAASGMPNFIGCMVDQRYQLVRMLGSGTYGVVYQAVDTHPTPKGASRSRAVKMMRKAGRKPHELAAARREIALHILVSDHPNIVTVYDSYEDNDYFYIIMDFCRGGDLFEPIYRQLYVDNDALLRTAFVSLIDAVQACHSSRVFHRDLKPENILVSEDRSQVYLADFGLATNRTLTEEFYCGTATYMSPECIGRMSNYKPYHTSCSDVWALGVIFVNMISGRNPWERASLDDPCFIQFIENPDFLLDVLPISEGANDIIRRAFVLNPLARISLPAFRRAVLELDTFFRTEDELSVVEEYAKGAAPTFGIPEASPVHNADSGFEESAPLEVDLAELKPSGSMVFSRSAVPVAGDQSCHATLPVPEFPGYSSGSSSSGSSPASSMVVTPDATAVGAVSECEQDVAEAHMRKSRVVSRLDSALNVSDNL
ncbi:kinase-like domain-containing protein [Daedaleopsis nitida]|nr:kinase-like domain-containing protein [Daedaleopsis nitida]